ncbi:ABC transporter substrate-binding protein [uncultured Roseibium sp.]|uniref:ABC transporter substrate-binding protein n=1 Tax=uncultured Roseibium sp. TaxID=1936171 RepID=UPI003216ABC9
MQAITSHFRHALVASVLSLSAVLPAHATEDVSLRISWLMNVQNAGYVMALEKGFYEDAGLNVEIFTGGPNINSTAMVASGQNTFGTNDVSTILFGNAQGMDLVIVGACFQKNPAGVLSLAKTGIKEPKDLEGKTLAYTEGGPWTYTQAMLNAAGVDMDKINKVVMAGNEVLMTGQVDAKTSFVVNEPVALQVQGYETATLVPADYGVNAYAETIFTTADYAAENADTIKGFMSATAKGWDYAFSHQEEAVAAVLARNPELNPEQQKRQLALEEDFVKSADTAKNGLCSVETSKVADSYEILKAYGGLEGDLDIPAMVKTEFNVGQ